jgi:hypothetical protein
MKKSAKPKTRAEIGGLDCGEFDEFAIASHPKVSPLAKPYVDYDFEEIFRNVDTNVARKRELCDSVLSFALKCSLPAQAVPDHELLATIGINFVGMIARANPQIILAHPLAVIAAKRIGLTQDAK